MFMIPAIISLFEVVLVLVPALLAVAYVTVAERKTMASMQRRLGLNVVGLLQAFADALKHLLEVYVYIWIQNVVSVIIYNFQFNLQNYGLLTAFKQLFFYLYNIIVPKTLWERFCLYLLFYIWLPENISIFRLFDMIYSLQNTFFVLLQGFIFTYVIFIMFLDISICFFYNKQFKTQFPLLDFIITLFLFLILVSLVCLLLLLIYLIIGNIFSSIIEYLSEFLVKMFSMWGAFPSTPGSFGQSTGGGGKPPRKPNGFEPPKGHYEDNNEEGDRHNDGLSSQDEDAEGETDYEYWDNKKKSEERNDKPKDARRNRTNEEKKEKSKQYNRNYYKNLTDEVKQQEINRRKYLRENRTTEQVQIDKEKSRIYDANRTNEQRERKNSSLKPRRQILTNEQREKNRSNEKRRWRNITDEERNRRNENKRKRYQKKAEKKE